MPTANQRDMIYATMCMAVLVFVAFYGAYTGASQQVLSHNLSSRPIIANKDTSESKLSDQSVNSQRVPTAEGYQSPPVGQNAARDESDSTILGQSEQITVLLHEYDALRGEIVQRWVGMQQQISIGVVVLLGIITVLFQSKIEHPRDYVLYGLLAIAVCIFCYAMWQVARDSGKAAERVREIELDVNRRAGTRLLEWETLWGGRVVGYWGISRPLKISTTEKGVSVPGAPDPRSNYMQDTIAAIALLMSALALVTSFTNSYMTFWRVRHSLRAVVVPDSAPKEHFTEYGTAPFFVNVVVVNNGNRTESVLRMRFLADLGGQILTDAPAGPFVLKSGDSLATRVSSPISSNNNTLMVPNKPVVLAIEITTVDSGGAVTTHSIEIGTLTLIDLQGKNVWDYSIRKTNDLSQELVK